MAAIVRSTDIKGALRSRQRGFLLNPYRFAPAGGGGESDPYYANRALGLHFDSITPYVDNSPTPKAITAFNAPTLDTVNKQFGAGSLAFNGSNQYLTAGVAADWTFLHNGTNWTIDFFWRLTTSGQEPLSTGNSTGIRLFRNATNGQLIIYVKNAGAHVYDQIGINSSTAVDGIFRHIEITHDASLGSGQIKLYTNGILQGSTSRTGSYAAGAPSANLNIGRSSIDAFYIGGNLDDVRIANGIVRHTANFTPPAAPFSDS